MDIVRVVHVFRGSPAGVIQLLSACNLFWAFSLAKRLCYPRTTVSESAMPRDVTAKSLAWLSGCDSAILYSTIPEAHITCASLPVAAFW
jgi:hypothetical protein